MPLSCQKLLIAASLAVSLDAKAQSSLDSLAGQFIKNVRSESKEKIIVLTDKEFYLVGESVWLKAWCLDSLSHRFIHISKNLFVDLVDDRDSVISQLLFNIPERKTAGNILLPGSLHEGYYWLRAYTTKILKGDSSRIFVKPIYVVNPNKPDPKALSAYSEKPVVVQEDSSAPRVEFIPEGGSIISGTTATVAFRSSGLKGQPVDITGYVTDPLHDTVARFSTSLPGTGKFSFDAFNPRKYVAHVKWRGREVIYPLPAIDQFASQLTVVSQDDRSIRLRVSLGDSLYKKHKMTRILGISRDSLCFVATGTDMYEVNIPKTNFLPGKAAFFLFDDRDRLVSQREVYIVGNDTSLVLAATDKSGYGPGEKVNLHIGVRPQNDNFFTGALLSVSVTDDQVVGEHKVQHSGIADIDEALSKKYTPDEIDLLMLMEPLLYPDWKYGRGSTATMDAGRDPDSSLLDLRGRAVNKNDEPLKNFIVDIFSGDKRFFESDTTDANGRFLFPLSDYDDGTQFNIKLTTLSGKGQEGKLILDKFAYPQFHTPRGLKQGFDPAEITVIRRFRGNQAAAAELQESGMLKPVTVKATRGLPDYDEARRVSRFSNVITPDQIRSGGIDVILNALSAVPGLTTGVDRTASGAVLNFLIIMDGVDITVPGDLKTYFESLDANNIEFVEVLQGPQTAIYGVQGGGGVIIINTINRVNDIAKTNDKGITTIYPKGYFSQPDVFASGYDKKDAKKSASSDQISTLYWNATVFTDNKGNAQLNFFTGKQQGIYSAAIIGITGSGDIFSKKIRIRCE